MRKYGKHTSNSLVLASKEAKAKFQQKLSQMSILGLDREKEYWEIMIDLYANWTNHQIQLADCEAKLQMVQTEILRRKSLEP